jgi:hypothetical protein
VPCGEHVADRTIVDETRQRRQQLVAQQDQDSTGDGFDAVAERAAPRSRAEVPLGTPLDDPLPRAHLVGLELVLAR